MRAAEIIAQQLFEAGIRLRSRWDRRALALTPDHLRHDLAKLWLESLGHNVDIRVNAHTVRTIGAFSAWLESVFEDMQRSDISLEVDHALWSLQMRDIDEKRLNISKEIAA